MFKIIYANSNHDDNQYINECIISAKSFRKYIPNAWIELYTNSSGKIDNVFDMVSKVDYNVPKKLKKRDHKRGQMLVKMNAMVNTEHLFNLYLGCDTFAMSRKVIEPFKLLKQYDLALVHAPKQQPLETTVPDCYREWNCDVIYWKKNKKTKSFLKEWRRLYRNDLVEHPHDQGSFRHLAWNRPDLRIYTLPFHYNNRCGMFGDQSQFKFDRWMTKDSVIIQNRDVVKQSIEYQQKVADAGFGTDSEAYEEYWQRTLKYYNDCC